jgi:hypothetical protein
VVQEKAPEQQETPAAPPVDFTWKTQTIQWGTRARIHKDGGLTLAATNVGAYGEIPDFWEDRTRMPRGAFSPPGMSVAPSGG